jgi:hypothetical protein
LLGARVYFLAQENIKPFHCRDRVIATAADASLLVESRPSLHCMANQAVTILV